MYNEQEVSKALAALEEVLEKASEEDLTNPEGSDLDAGTHAGEKLSEVPNEDEGASGAAKKTPKSVKKGEKAAEEEEDEENEKPDKDEEKMKSLNADTEIKQAIEVSDFLKSLHGSLNDTLESMQDVIKSSGAMHATQIKSLEERIDDIQMNQAKLGVVLKAMCEHMGMLGNQAAREAKSVAKSGGAAGQPAERKFVDPAQVLEEAANKSAMFPGMSANPIVAKSQLLDAAMELAKSGKIGEVDVINLEANGHMRPEVATLIQKSFVAKSQAA